MVHIDLTDDEANKIIDWLNDSFMNLEIGGSHRIAAVRLMENIRKQL